MSGIERNAMPATPQTAIWWRYKGQVEWCSGYASIDAKQLTMVKIGKWPGDQHGREILISQIDWKYKGYSR
jgi:hypothetical protein